MEWIGPTVLKNQPVRDVWRSFPWLQPKLALYLLLVLNTYCTIIFMLWRIPVVKIAPISSFTVLLQPFKVDPFTAKYFTKISSFSNSLFFSHTLWPPWMDLRFVDWFIWCNYLFFLYLSHVLLDFSESSTTFYLMHTLQVQQFSELFCHLILLQNILYTAE